MTENFKILYIQNVHVNHENMALSNTLWIQLRIMAFQFNVAIWQHCGFVDVYLRIYRHRFHKHIDDLSEL